MIVKEKDFRRSSSCCYVHNAEEKSTENKTAASFSLLTLTARESAIPNGNGRTPLNEGELDVPHSPYTCLSPIPLSLPRAALRQGSLFFWIPSGIRAGEKNDE